MQRRENLVVSLFCNVEKFIQQVGQLATFKTEKTFQPFVGSDDVISAV